MAKNKFPPPPNWMLKLPEPEREERILSGISVKGWLGWIPLEEIHAYVDNRRTDRQVATLKKTLGKKVPTDDTLFDFLKDDPELDIERLAQSIIQNGLRVPLVISYDRVLLDGNRRYFAHRWITQNADSKSKSNFEKIRAWVLDEEFSDSRNKLRVVAEYNFLDDLKVEWNDYVKAKLLWEEYNDSKKNHTYETLTELYGGPGFGRAKIIEFIKTYEIIMEYVRQSSDEEEAIAKTSENFIWFQQLQRSNRDEIRNDDEFQKGVFTNIREDNIVRTDQLKNLRDVYRYKDAWASFKKGDIKRAHDLRIFHQQDEKEHPDPDQALGDINVRLEALLKNSDHLVKLSIDKLIEFHQFAERVPGQVRDVNLRVNYVMERLEGITSSELASITPAGLEQLVTALDRVIKQVNATRGKR